MVLRSLDDPSDILTIKEDEQGDIYIGVVIGCRRGSCMEYVRVGGANSGHEIPVMIRHYLHELAHEFKKYENVSYENEAARMEGKAMLRQDIDQKISSTKEMLRLCGEDNALMNVSLSNRLKMYEDEKVNLEKQGRI